MESIAEAAGVTKPVLYQHFSSKRALYSALLANDLGRLTKELEVAFSQAESNGERLRQGFGAYLDFVDRHEDAFRLLFTEALGLDADFQQQVAEFRRWVAGRVATIIAEAGLDAPRARALAAASAPARGTARPASAAMITATRPATQRRNSATDCWKSASSPRASVNSRRKVSSFRSTKST